MPAAVADAFARDMEIGRNEAEHQAIGSLRQFHAALLKGRSRWLTPTIRLKSASPSGVSPQSMSQPPRWAKARTSLPCSASCRRSGAEASATMRSCRPSRMVSSMFFRLDRRSTVLARLVVSRVRGRDRHGQRAGREGIAVGEQVLKGAAAEFVASCSPIASWQAISNRSSGNSATKANADVTQLDKEFEQRLSDTSRRIGGSTWAPADIESEKQKRRDALHRAEALLGEVAK